MNRLEYLDLQGEKSTLERMIAETPEENVIDRGSLVARLEDIQERLANYIPDKLESALEQRERLGWRPLSEEQRAAQLEANLDYFLDG
jgi:hypothetical protein